MDNNLSGGYTSFRAFNNEEKEMFDDLIQHLAGPRHEPLAVATQVVSGVNYAFLCKSNPIGPSEADSYNTLVIIHKPLPHVNGIPHILEIRMVKII